MARKISPPEGPNPDGDVRYTPNIASRPYNLRAQLSRHISGDNPGETEMKTTKLRLVTFGSAKALTRDLTGGLYMEINAFDSSKPVA